MPRSEPDEEGRVADGTTGAPLSARELPALLERVHAALTERRDALDDLNVFPVPDGDTGTNMTLTVRAGLEALRRASDATPDELARAVIRGAVRGARGNSGVILSQVVRAVVEVLSGHREVDTEVYARALEHARQLAYEAVAEPVEGTILTAISAACAAASSAVADGLDLVAASARIVEATAEAVERTQDQLAVLTEAGVVDAGARGFEVVLAAVHGHLTGEDAPVVHDEDRPHRVEADPDACHGSLHYRFEVQYLLDADDDVAGPLRHRLEVLGDSVVVVAAGGLLNVHVHTDDVGARDRGGATAWHALGDRGDALRGPDLRPPSRASPRPGRGRRRGARRGVGPARSRARRRRRRGCGGCAALGRRPPQRGRRRARQPGGDPPRTQERGRDRPQDRRRRRGGGRTTARRDRTSDLTPRRPRGARRSGPRGARRAGAGRHHRRRRSGPGRRGGGCRPRRRHPGRPVREGQPLAVTDGKVVGAYDDPLDALGALCDAVGAADAEIVTLLVGAAVGPEERERAWAQVDALVTGELEVDRCRLSALALLGRRRVITRQAEGGEGTSGGALPAEELVHLDDRVDVLPGVGAKARTSLAETFGIVTIRDLLEHYPRRYQDAGEVLDLSQVREGEPATLLGEVLDWSTRRIPGRGKKRPLQIAEGRVRQASGATFTVTFFNQNWRANQLGPGTVAAFSGKVKRFQRSLQLASPDVQVLGKAGTWLGGDDDPATRLQHQRLLAIYPATEAWPSFKLANLIETALQRLVPAPDWLPVAWLDELDLLTLDDAIRGIHLPPDHATRKAARRRLVFDELLSLQLGLQWRRAHLESETVGLDNAPVTGGKADAFLLAMPFKPTGAQDRAFAEIADDLAAPRPMHRLLQGDVGSGKTVVAVWTLLNAIDHGRQAALMVPTEVLADQHGRTLTQLLAPLGVNVLDGIRVGRP
jgi:uncharacterized protein